MNPETMLTLDQAVDEVLGLLTGLELSYDPQLNRYRAIVRQLNRAMRSTALEQEWGYYASEEIIGQAQQGLQEVRIRPSLRIRGVNDDAARLVDEGGVPRVWAYFLPRDAIHKYRNRPGLWCSVIGNRLRFSRPFMLHENELDIEVPVMREPRMFRLPESASEGGDPLQVPEHIRDQLVDFPYPDLVIVRAAFYYAQTDPVMQPRVQTLEAQYKDLMYQVMERDSRITDTPYINEWNLPIINSLNGAPSVHAHGHPHADHGGW